MGPILSLLFLVQSASSAAPADTGRFTASGLWFRSFGRGSPVLLVHGADLDSRSLASVADALAPNHQVILTDLRFHGHSRDSGGAFSFEGDLLEVLDAAGVRRAAVIGHSLGATVAIDLALAHPERVSRLVLIGPAISGLPAKRPPGGFAEMVAAVRRGDMAAAGVILGNAPVMTLYRDTADQAVVRTMVAENTRLLAADFKRIRPLGAPAAGRLETLRLPLLAIVGEKDPTEAGDAAALLHDKVPGARLEIIPGCGHLTPIDCRQETARLIAAFLK